MTKFDKAKTKSTKPHKKPWWVINCHKYSYPIWALPIIPFCALSDIIKEKRYKRLVWDETKATKVLDKTLPKLLSWDEDEKAYGYCMGWWASNLWRCAPRLYRAWAKKFSYQLQKFIAEGYENANYTKSLDNDGDVWVMFYEKNS